MHDPDAEWPILSTPGPPLTHATVHVFYDGDLRETYDGAFDVGKPFEGIRVLPDRSIQDRNVSVTNEPNTLTLDSLLLLREACKEECEFIGPMRLDIEAPVSNVKRRLMCAPRLPSVDLPHALVCSFSGRLPCRHCCMLDSLIVISISVCLNHALVRCLCGPVMC